MEFSGSNAQQQHFCLQCGDFSITWALYLNPTIHTYFVSAYNYVDGILLDFQLLKGTFMIIH